MDILKNIENRKDLKKDIRSHAVINIDTEAYLNYMNMVKTKQAEEARITNLENKVDDIMSKLNIILERVCK